MTICGLIWKNYVIQLDPIIRFKTTFQVQSYSTKTRRERGVLDPHHNLKVSLDFFK